MEKEACLRSGASLLEAGPDLRHDSSVSQGSQPSNLSAGGAEELMFAERCNQVARDLICKSSHALAHGSTPPLLEKD